MSFECYECQQDVQPGMVFPGREGGVLRPGTASKRGKAVCFECLLGACVTAKGQIALRRVFACYNAEVEYARFRAQYAGFVSDGVPEGKELRDSFDAVHKSIPANACLCCDGSLPDGDKRPFSFHVMDRLYGESRKSFFGSYQWSLSKIGLTSFLMCATCVETHLPRSFAFLTDAKLPEQKTPVRRSQIIHLDKLSQEQIDQVNEALPEGFHFIG